jgi:hypothetical protein
LRKAQDRIARLVNRAEECRVLANIVVDELAAASYLRLADSYELLAEDERRLAALAAVQVTAFQAITPAE